MLYNNLVAKKNIIERLEQVANEHYGSLSQLAKELGLSSGYFYPYKSRGGGLGAKALKTLEKGGINTHYLKTGEGTPFNNLITKPTSGYGNVIRQEAIVAPVLMQKVPAGATAPYDTAFQEAFLVSSDFEGKDPFMCWVVGDSMSPDYNDGELVTCVRNDTPQDGDVVVAIVNGEATIKKLKTYPKSDKIGLIPINEEYPPILCGEHDDCYIMGVVVNVSRITNKRWLKKYT